MTNRLPERQGDFIIFMNIYRCTINTWLSGITLGRFLLSSYYATFLPGTITSTEHTRWTSSYCSSFSEQSASLLLTPLDWQCSHWSHKVIYVNIYKYTHTEYTCKSRCMSINSQECLKGKIIKFILLKEKMAIMSMGHYLFMYLITE